jgi:hypothetical protein
MLFNFKLNYTFIKSVTHIWVRMYACYKLFLLIFCEQPKLLTKACADTAEHSKPTTISRTAEQEWKLGLQIAVILQHDD